MSSIHNIFVSGSLAYDRIMNFPGQFKEHILPDKTHILNVSFVVNKVNENFGGTAGNIAYNLALLGENPKVLAVAGEDFEKYKRHLEGKNVDTSYIKIFKGYLTASAHIMTDKDDNQITAFYPGPLDLEYCQNVKKLVENNENNSRIPLPPFYKRESRKRENIAIIAPDYQKRMMEYVKIYKEAGLEYIFDPGQQITEFNSDELLEALSGAVALIGNDYEIQLILNKLEKRNLELKEVVEILVVTKGKDGSEVYYEGKKILIPPAKPSTILDPTGAGDAYRAGFIRGLLEGWPLEKVGRFAGIVAVYAVEKYGTQEHYFTWDDLAKRYKKNFGEQL